MRTVAIALVVSLGLPGCLFDTGGKPFSSGTESETETDTDNDGDTTDDDAEDDGDDGADATSGTDDGTDETGTTETDTTGDDGADTETETTDDTGVPDVCESLNDDPVACDAEAECSVIFANPIVPDETQPGEWCALPVEAYGCTDKEICTGFLDYFCLADEIIYVQSDCAPPGWIACGEPNGVNQCPQP